MTGDYVVEPRQVKSIITINVVLQCSFYLESVFIKTGLGLYWVTLDI